jgi:hypothetical protein
LLGSCTGRRTNLSPEACALALNFVHDHDRSRVVALVERGHARDARQHLPKQLDAFRPEGIGHEAQAGDVAARPGQACNQPGFDWIGHPHHDDGNGLRGLLGRLHRGRIDGNDDTDFQPQQLMRELAKPLGLSRRISQLDDNGFPLDVAELVQLFTERFQQSRLQVLGQHADAVSRRRSLALRGDGRRNC